MRFTGSELSCMECAKYVCNLQVTRYQKPKPNRVPGAMAWGPWGILTVWGHSVSWICQYCSFEGGLDFWFGTVPACRRHETSVNPLQRSCWNLDAFNGKAVNSAVDAANSVNDKTPGATDGMESFGATASKLNGILKDPVFWGHVHLVSSLFAMLSCIFCHAKLPHASVVRCLKAQVPLVANRYFYAVKAAKQCCVILFRWGDLAQEAATTGTWAEQCPCHSQTDSDEEGAGEAKHGFGTFCPGPVPVAAACPYLGCRAAELATNVGLEHQRSILLQDRVPWLCFCNLATRGPACPCAARAVLGFGIEHCISYPYAFKTPFTMRPS